jgi:hypothetical protein
MESASAASPQQLFSFVPPLLLLMAFRIPWLDQNLVTEIKANRVLLR